MPSYNAKNERIKREYFDYKRGPDRKDEKTIESIRGSINRFEAYTRHTDFAKFNRQQARAFRTHLSEKVMSRSGKPLALATQLSIIRDLQSFFTWLAYQKGYKSKIDKLDVEYLNLSANETRTAKSSAPVAFPTIEQVRHVINTMPNEAEIERRDRAIIAFTILTAIRDSALISLKLKHYDPNIGWVSQDPNDVRTKRAKRIETFMLPVGEDFFGIVNEWVRYLKEDKLFGMNDPLFPKTLNSLDVNNCFVASGISREHWAGTQAVRNVFKSAFELAELPYYHPHTFRHTLTHWGQQVCQSTEEFKALSQNLGHNSVLTTLISYGHVPHHRQGEIIRDLGKTKSASIDYDALAKAIVAQQNTIS